MSVVVPDVAVELGDANVAGEEVPLPPHEGTTVGSVIHDAAAAVGGVLHSAADAAHGVVDAAQAALDSAKHVVHDAVHGGAEPAQPATDGVEVPVPAQEDAAKHSVAHDAAAAVDGAVHTLADGVKGAANTVKRTFGNAVHGGSNAAPADVDSQADGHNGEHKPDFSVGDDQVAESAEKDSADQSLDGLNWWQKTMTVMQQVLHAAYTQCQYLRCFATACCYQHQLSFRAFYDYILYQAVVNIFHSSISSNLTLS
jgi:hypothetical protein